MWPLHLVVLCFLGRFAVTNALYYIDDQDSFLTYNSSAGIGYNDKWRKYSRKCFDGTASYTQCYPEDHCTITIPFNGTGITLFVAMDFGDIYNTSISLDGAPGTNHFTYQNDSKASGYNMTLYDIQGLNWNTHSLKVGLEPGVSRLLFDYAAVTGDKPNGGATSLAGVFSFPLLAAVVAIITTAL
ncbi:hypothetical protein B0H16DRAFT_1538932 [Mycena metata]|uniref:Uncharacterized protein n=1 Tax=Mycena metata TaxID=1033252 RepID=A0AAD7J3U2_9AGAR|nr:hypothetical protein B0H16DRAFT_1538932 [Mycena metata]